MFNAFISYSHTADDKFAPALQDALQKFAKPLFQPRALKIFRDETSLSASPLLWENIKKALDQSEYLILLASPLSENSKWVNEEVNYWIAHKSIDTILIALTAGEMLWDNEKNCFLDPNNNSLPPSLDDKFENEPFYIDLRQSKTEEDLSLDNPIFKKEILKLAAKLHGKAPNDLASEEVTVHRKMIRLRNGVIGTLSLLLIVAVGLGIFADEKRKEANKQTIEAEKQTIEAEKQTQIAKDSSLAAQEQRQIALIQTQIARDSSESAQKERENAIVALKKAIESDSLAQIERDIAVKQAATSRALLLNNTAKNLFSKGMKTEALRVAEVAYRTVSEANTHAPTPLLSSLSDAFYSDYPFQLLKINHTSEIHSVAFSPDGKTILTGNTDKTAILWDIKGNKIRTFQEQSDSVSSVAFSPDGKTILTGTQKAKAILWDLRGNILQTFHGHNEKVTSVAFSPDGKSILTGSWDEAAILWDIKGNTIQTFKTQNQNRNRVYSVAFSPNGTTILTGRDNATTILWSLMGDTIQSFKGNDFLVLSAAFSPDGKSIFSGGGNLWSYLEKNIYSEPFLWDLKGETIQTFKGHFDNVSSAAFSPNGKTILTGSYDNTAILWDLKGNKIQTFLGHNGMVYSVAFSPDGKSILTGSYDRTAIVWNLLEENKIKTFHTTNKESGSYEFSLDGSVIESEYETYLFYDLEGNEHIGYEEHEEWNNSIAFTSNRKYILSGSDDNTAILWDLNEKEIQTFEGHKDWVKSVAFSPNEKYVLTGSLDHTAILWDLDGNPIEKPFHHSAGVHSAAFSPDGEYILTGSEDGTAILWDLKRNIIQTFRGHNDWVISVSFSPEGKYILTGSDDNTAILWDLKGNAIKTFQGHEQPVSSVSFSPDGKSILTGSHDGTAILWKTPQGIFNWLQSPECPLRQLTEEEKVRYGIIEGED